MKILSRFHPTRFDWVVFSAIGIILLGIILTVILGDHVGVQVAETSLTGDTISVSSPITIRFSESMNEETVPYRIRTEPEFEFAYQLAGDTLTIQPESAFEPDTQYTVTLQAGMESEDGRSLMDDTVLEFTTRHPRVAYLAPASSAPANIWIADWNDPESAEQVTFSELGIYSFGVSPDGTQVVYNEVNRTGQSDLFMLDLESGEIQRLTDCQDAICANPVWRPDGKMIAYERSASLSPTRVWLLDLSTTPYTTRPLFSDSQMLGYSPRWSADGRQIAVYESVGASTLVFDFNDGSLDAIPNRYGVTAEISPDGTKTVFAEPVFDPSMSQQAYQYLRMVDLEENELIDLTHPDDPIDDDMPVWSPDGETLVFTRRYMDNRYTEGRQVYQMELATGDIFPLITDGEFANGSISFSPSGQLLLLQRYPQSSQASNVQGQPGIWTFEFESEGIQLIAEDAFLPQWVP